MRRRHDPGRCRSRERTERLFALVVLALVPALVILIYDEWLARQRGFQALTDVSSRVVRLLQLDLDGRITRAAGRLGTLVVDPEIVSFGPLAGRRLVDAFQADRLYNDVALVDGGTGDLRFAGLLQAVEAEATVVAGAIASLGEPVAPAAAPAAAGKTASPEAVRALLVRLRTALEESDPSMASGALGELRTLGLPGESAGRLGLVATRLGAYAFEEAIPVVDEMIAGLPQAGRL